MLDDLQLIAQKYCERKILVVDFIIGNKNDSHWITYQKQKLGICLQNTRWVDELPKILRLLHLNLLDGDVIQLHRYRKHSKYYIKINNYRFKKLKLTKQIELKYYKHAIRIWTEDYYFRYINMYGLPL
jgi:hypothetical protein